VRGATTKETPVRPLSSALVAILILALISGCGSSDSEGDAALPNGRVPVVGTSEGRECRWEGQRSQQTDDPTIAIMLGTLICPSEMSDPRVSGEERWELKDPHYIWYTSVPNTGRFEASVVLTTEDGIWRGEGFGSDLWDDQGGLHTTFYAEYIGEGSYEGFVYREWGAQYPGSDGYLITGYIEPAD
jgi:hypothetical protein